MIVITAHLIVVPYLWFFGYPTDADSIATCHDSIARSEQEANNEDCKCAFTFTFTDSE
jgi:hypothetical protein